jgi:hypothetical protein
MRSSKASHVVECERCGEEYEIDFTIWPPDKSVGDHGGAELDGPTECPCGHKPTDDEVETMAQQCYESFTSGGYDTRY